jgi:hypothetical protein
MKTIFAPRTISPPHDHRVWAAVAVYQGQEVNVFYRRSASGLARSVEQLRVSFPLFQHLTKKKLLRGNKMGALAFYYSHTLRPLLTLLRIRHCPDRFDFGPRYSRVDLPPTVVDGLESLWFVSTPAELEAKCRRAEECFYATMDEITSGQSLNLSSNTERDVHGEMNSLFEGYAAAFNAFDGDAVAAFYRVPCLIITTDYVVSLSTSDAMQTNMR